MNKIFYAILFLGVQVLANNVSASNHEIKEYGIALIPENKCTKKAELFNSKANKYLDIPSAFNIQNNWHTTLFQGAFRVIDIQNIANELRMLPSSQPIELIHNKIHATGTTGIVWDVTETDILNRYHKYAVKIGGAYYKKPLQRVKDSYDKLSFEQRAQVDTYGTYNILNSYHPHTTIYYSTTPNSNLDKIADRISKYNDGEITCKADYLAIGELGYHGNLTKIIYKIDLPE